VQSSLTKKIAGEVVLSDDPGSVLRKWREEFKISQLDMARHIGVSPSVISDYESGRRSSPGSKTIKRLVEAMLEIDKSSGRGVSRRFEESFSEVIPSIRELPAGIRQSAFLKKIEGRLLTPMGARSKSLFGYTVIDSIKAITTLDASDYLRIFGTSSERALIFTGVTFGRSPMVAIRAQPLKPALVVYVRPENVDALAVKLAELSNISLARTELDTDELIRRLERL
jgi:putative transcriptional regulator